MRFNKVIATLVIAASIVGGIQVYAQDRTEPKDSGVTLAETVGAQVDEALRAAKRSGLGGLDLQKAVLTLETGTTTQSGLQLSFLIFTISHKDKKSATQTTTLQFGQSKAASGNLVPVGSITEPLANAIAQAGQVAGKIKTLPLSQSTIKLEFAVDKDNSGAIKFTILGITPSANIDFDKTSKNSLELTFAIPKA